MKKYTVAENRVRKEIFNYVKKETGSFSRLWRGFYGYIYKDSCTLKKMQDFMKSAIARKNNKCISYDKKSFQKKLFENYCTRKCHNWADTLPYSGYSMGEWKIIRNEFSEKFFYDKILGTPEPISEVDCTSEYAKSCKWKATHGCVSVKFPLSIVLSAFLSGGVLTVLGRKITSCIYRCKVVVYDYKRYRGKIDSCDYHLSEKFFCRYKGQEFHAETLEEAKRKVQSWKDAEKNIILQNKALAPVVRKFLKKVFTYKDSIAAGNCIAGTNAFCQRHGLNHNSTMTGKELWKISEKDSAGSYARRMIVDAIYRLTSVSKDKIKEYIDFKVYKK